MARRVFQDLFPSETKLREVNLGWLSAHVESHVIAMIGEPWLLWGAATFVRERQRVGCRGWCPGQSSTGKRG